MQRYQISREREGAYMTVVNGAKYFVGGEDLKDNGWIV